MESKVEDLAITRKIGMSFFTSEAKEKMTDMNTCRYTDFNQFLLIA
jgi:hypothetical protein